MGCHQTSCTSVRFVDTELLLYAISHAPNERDKAAQANEILRARDLALSVQVLQEFYVEAIRESGPLARLPSRPLRGPRGWPPG